GSASRCDQDWTANAPHQSRARRQQVLPTVCRRYFSDPLSRRSGASQDARRVIANGADFGIGPRRRASGVWSVALAQRLPNIRVTAVDWPGIIPITKKVAARNGLADRYTFVAGDLSTADFGQGHTIATLGHILHSEGEERSRRL